MRLRSLLLAIAVVTPLRAFAQTPAPAEAAPPPAAAAASRGSTAAAAAPAAARGHAAAGCRRRADGPRARRRRAGLEGFRSRSTGWLTPTTCTTSPARPASTPPLGRQFDTNSNTFTLNYTKVGIGINADPVGFRLDMGYGATGAIINSALPSDATSSPSANTVGPMVISNPFLVQQAYATVSPLRGLTIDFGKFVTTAGAEVIEANKNWLYSRSILFFNIPLLHTGLRVGYKVNDAFSIQASVVNGWNGLGINPDITGAKTFGLSLNFTAPTGTNIVATGYFGKGEAGSRTTPVSWPTWSSRTRWAISG